jgi:hypothetical protein
MPVKAKQLEVERNAPAVIIVDQVLSHPIAVAKRLDELRVSPLAAHRGAISSGGRLRRR